MTDSRPEVAPEPPAVPFATMLRIGIIVNAVCLPVLAIIFWITNGPKGGGSAAIGVLVALVFFAGGLGVLQRVSGDNALLLLAAAFTVYLGQVIFLGIIILALSERDWIDGWAFGLSVLVTALAWQVAQVTGFVRAPKAVYSELSENDVAEEGGTR
ncbi:hypothetical protein [Flexivirga alba]|uniref:ATP synthase protein I n=1 Tax=Flexivirga alba TaxID=702742 RepID=A0ABW2AG80_9MICO